MRWFCLALSFVLPTLGFAAEPTTATDVGQVAAAGSTSVTSGVYTVRASGADIWGTRDEFHFFYASMSGDGELTARVDDLTATDSWTKAGVMIRESLGASSRYAYTLVSATNGAAFQYRRSTGGNAGPGGVFDGTTRTPSWVRLRRVGNRFTAYVSADGQSWRQQGNSIDIGMSSRTYVGLAVTSHRDGAIATARFSNVSIAAVGATPVPTNTPPTISGTPATTATADVPYAFTPTTTDPDGNTLTYSIANRPSWAVFNAGTGRLSGTPTSAHVGTYADIRISVSDGQAAAHLAPFSVVVGAATNRAPVISGTPPTSAIVGIAYSFQPTASDPDGNALSFSITNAPPWTTFSTTTGRLQGTPAASHVGTYANIVIRVSDGQTTAQLPAFSIAVGSGTTNRAPVISGVPPTSVTPGSAYWFQPTASDPDGDPLTFSIVNAPSWATFDSTTGRLQGTPTASHVGTFNNITISVSDGRSTASLTAFNIAVVAVASGSATLMWTPPTQNTDGSALTNLAGYRIYWGTAAGSYTSSVDIGNPGLTTYVVENLVPGTYYFAVTARNSAGIESALSDGASKTIL